MCNKEQGWSHILRCEETRSWREDLVDKRFTSTEPEIGIRSMATIKDNDKLQKVGPYLSKCEEKSKRSMMKYEEEKIKKLGGSKSSECKVVKQM
jgi:hypothetical protein